MYKTKMFQANNTDDKNHESISNDVKYSTPHKYAVKVKSHSNINKLIIRFYLNILRLI